MTYDHLSDFLSELQDEGKLVRVSAEVDSLLELSEITNRMSQSDSDGPALFFEKVKGHSIPVVTNLLGSELRMCKALRTDSLDALANRIIGLIRPDVPQNWLDALKLVPSFTELSTLPPKIMNNGICQQVVKMGRDVDLSELPIPTVWPDDAGPTITAGQVITAHPETNARNVELFPVHITGKDSLVAHCNIHHGGWRNFVEYEKQQKQMPVAIAIGGDPALTFCASLPLPDYAETYLFGGFLRDANVPLVRCRSIELDVPANSEIVLEGFVDTTAELESTGPIGSPTGFYSTAEELPKLQVTAVTHRANPVLPVIIPGKPPSENDWYIQAASRIFLPLIKLYIPEIIDYHIPRSAAVGNLLFVSIKKEYPQQARKVMNALWGLGPFMGSKMIVVVDAEVDVHDEGRVWFSVGANCHPGRDTIFCEGPADNRDHAAAVRGMGHKMGIDATRKLPEEGHPRDWPAELNMTEEIQQQVTARWDEYGLGKVMGESPE